MKKIISSLTAPSVLLAASLFFSGGCAPPPEVTVHYLGHSSFLLQFGEGPTVLTDYGESNAYGLDSPIFSLGEVIPEILTISHNHADHFGGDLPPGIETTLTGGESFRSGKLTITPIPTFESSLVRPDNFSYLFEYRGLKVLHLGDCQGLMVALRGGLLGEGGRLYSPEDVAEMIRGLYPDSYDLVLLPIGFTRDILPEAAEFAGYLDARTIVPMHFWSLEDRDAFLTRMADRRDAGDRPYSSRIVEEAGFQLTVVADPVVEVEVLGLTPAPVVSLPGVDARQTP